MRTSEPVRAVYGFRPDLAIFQGLSPQQIVDTLKSWGVNAVFGGYRDSALVQALHEAGIRVFAEIGFFVGESFWERYQCARPIKADGEPLEKIKWYAGLNPACEELVQHRLRELEELVRTYPVDGVWLDFIRWPAKWERPDPILPSTSFDPTTLRRFSEETGIQIPANLKTVPEKATWILENHEPEWTRFRCEVIRDVVRKAREICEKAGHKVLLGAFIVPWTDQDFDSALVKVVGQDIPLLAPLIDVFSPMVYHKLCGRQVPWVGKITEWVHTASGKPVWPIVQSMDEPSPLPVSEFEETLRTGLGARGSQGVIVFTLGKTSPDKLPALRRVFNEGR